MIKFYTGYQRSVQNFSPFSRKTVPPVTSAVLCALAWGHDSGPRFRRKKKPFTSTPTFPLLTVFGICLACSDPSTPHSPLWRRPARADVRTSAALLQPNPRPVDGGVGGGGARRRTGGDGWRRRAGGGWSRPRTRTSGARRGRRTHDSRGTAPLLPLV